MWEIEKTWADRGFHAICGIDEAGRGPLAGPVCAAAVILPEGLEIPGLNDSKKLTDKKRRELFPIIEEQALAYGIGWASQEEIDDINILQATFLAMSRAVEQLNIRPDLALVDGNRAPTLDLPVETVVNAVRDKDVHLVGLSALMTTTLKSMEETIAALRQANIPCKIMAGGAVLTPEYAKKIGADYYAKDAKQSADIAKSFFSVG